MPIFLTESARKNKKWVLEPRAPTIASPGSLESSLWCSPDRLRQVERQIREVGAESSSNLYYVCKSAGDHKAPIALSATRMAPNKDGDNQWGVCLYSLHGAQVAVVSEDEIKAGFFARLFGRKIAPSKAAKAAYDILAKQLSARAVDPSFSARQLSLRKMPVTPANLRVLAETRRQEYALSHCHKVGVLYQALGQTKETDFYCNAQHSPLFDHFINWLGEKVVLKGYKGYRGGLDVRRDLTGPLSIVSKFTVKPMPAKPELARVIARPRGNIQEVIESEAIFASADGAVGEEMELMFHIASMMPTSTRDEQQVEKKRHIGNDNIVIVFSETINDMIDDSTFLSNMLMTVVNVWPISAPADTPLDQRRFAFQAMSRGGIPRVGPMFNDSPSGVQLNADTHAAFTEKLLGLTEGVWEDGTLKMSLTKMREASLKGLQF